MNKRLNIICILFAVTYLFLIFHYIFTEIIHIDIDIHKNDTEQAEEINNAPQEDETDESKLDVNVTYGFDFKPIKRSVSFPVITMNNLKTGQPVELEVREGYLNLQKEGEYSLLFYITFGLQMLVSTLKYVIAVYIPVLAIKVVRSISKNEIFDMKNITRIRKIGYSLTLLFVVGLISNWLTSMTLNDLVSLENYKISFFEIGDKTTYLLLGLTSLLFAEILKISLQMKEEQDLTV